MCAQIIEARVKQKKDTLANWEENPMILLDGEQAFVVNGDGHPVNFKIGDGTKRFSELPYWIQYDGGQYIQITGNVLPEPTVDLGYSLVGPGTYTFPGQPDVVAPEGRLSQLLWDGTSWSIVDMGELPVAPADGLVAESDTRAVSGGEVFAETMVKDIYLENLGKNLFDKEAVVYGKLIDVTTGEVTNSGIAGRAISDFIPVKEGESYIKSGHFSSAALNRTNFTKTKEYNSPSQVYVGEQTTFTAPFDGYIYFYVSRDESDAHFLDSIQLERGTEATPYEPFVSDQVINSKYILIPQGEVEEDNKDFVIGGEVFDKTLTKEVFLKVITGKNKYDKSKNANGVINADGTGR